MPSRKGPAVPPLEPKHFTSVTEIDRSVGKLERRIEDLNRLDISMAMQTDNAADEVLVSNVRDTIRDIFGSNSPEFREHQYIDLWAGPMAFGMSREEVLQGKERGRNQVRGILQGLIDRLREKRGDLTSSGPVSPKNYFDDLNLHPRIGDVSKDQFLDGYHWEAVFAAAKALVNYVKERSGRDDLDGAALMRTVFSRNNPVLSFSSLSEQTGLDEQEGMMHLFEGAVLAVRNPGGHSFPEGPEQRAIEYLSLLSLLAYRVQEAKKYKGQ